jgi:putrescine aminotransferase
MQLDQAITVDQALELNETDFLGLYSRHVNSVFAGSVEPFNLMRRYVRAEGCYLWDEKGRRYLDFFNGFGCLNLGHNHPAVLEAIQKGHSKGFGPTPAHDPPIASAAAPSSPGP